MTGANAFVTYRRQQAVAFATAGLVTLVVLAAPLALGLVYYGTDLMRSDVGYLCALRDQWQHHGDWLLTSNIGNGYFLWGHPVAQLLYPPRWIALVFEPDLGASVGALLHLALGASAAAWLAMTFGIRPWSACLAGLCFAFSGVSLDLFQRTFCIVAAAWLPLAWAAGRMLLRPSAGRRHVVLLAIALTMLLLGGESHEFAVAAGVIALETLVAGLSLRGKVLERGVRLAVIGIGSLALGMLALLPASAEAQLSLRSGLLSEKESLIGAFSPVSALGLVWPNVVLEPVAPDTSLWNVCLGRPAGDIRWDANPFLGPLLLIAGLMALGHRRTRTAAIVAIVGFLLAFGEHTPMLPLLLKVFPPLRLFRYPAKHALVGSLGLIVGAFAILQAAQRNAARRTRLLWVIGIASTVMAAIWIWIVRSGPLLAELAERSSAGRSAASLPTLHDVLWESCGGATIWLGIALLFLSVRGLRRFLPLLLLAQLLVAAPREVTLGPPLTEVRSPLAGHVTTLCVDPGIQERTWSLPDEPAYQSLKLFQRVVGLTDTQACSGLNSPVPYAPFQMKTTAVLNHELQKGSLAAARAMGCTHAVMLAPSEGGIEQPWPVEPSKQPLFAGLHFLEVSDPTPPAFVARSPRLIEERVIIPALLATRSAAEVLAVVDDPLARLTETQLPEGTGANDPVVEWAGRTQATVTTAGSGPAVVGIRTSFLAGWTASQGGTPLPVIRAAGQEVAALVADVAKGPVVFRYRVPRLVPALVSTLAGLLLLAGVLIQIKRRRA